jgi:succinate dehydrogenase flavin-adding protein (antitoxin of CptAB toxin-antitoxin module)
VSKKRLQWQLRRGLLELELLLNNFWQQRADELSDSELLAFSQLLALEDDRLWHLLHTNINQNTIDNVAITEKDTIIQQLKNTYHQKGEPA